ncbi:helix-turn-helix transcriptional regulator [Jiangella asiatica]|uniref:AraC family transcriptional regulator n=1 Tax=Jiangella asiatica TaxID=2530372 RepID=A0A4R5D6L2_9ACTN|nr:AraC family transcriptional regulator [Jiangella asiatica]TDE09109.1 AraC family transcriptional regulator [Jiangella asiatica]
MATRSGRRAGTGAGSAVVQTLVAVRRARDFIDRSYADPVELADIAAAAGYSRFHLVRAFQAAYGETPGRYLTRRRVERAQELLRVADLSVTEICHLVGFSSLGSFSSLFTDLVGVSPSRFQRDAHAAGPPLIPGCYILMWSGPHQQSVASRSKRATTEKPDGDGAP